MPERKQVRLKHFDYSSNGAYFVTICSKNKAHLFGRVVGAGPLAGPRTELSCLGAVVQRRILEIPQVYKGVLIDAYSVMPNHIHMVLRFECPEGPARGPAPTSLPKVISSLKSLSSRDAGTALWQRGYYEHVCRSYDDYIACAEYTQNNPAKWTDDEYYN